MNNSKRLAGTITDLEIDTLASRELPLVTRDTLINFDDQKQLLIAMFDWADTES